MKVVFLKVIDPIIWPDPEKVFYEEDLEKVRNMVLRHSGILIREDDELIIIGEVQSSEDNPELDDWGVEFPRYRHLTLIHKSQVIYRKDFEIDESSICEKGDTK